MSNVNDYIINTILKKREDLWWGIDLMFSGAANILTALQQLGDEFTVADVDTIEFVELDDNGNVERVIPAGKNLVAMLTEQWEDKQAEKAARKDTTTARKLANRSTYVAKSDLEVSFRESDKGCKYRYSQGLDAPGLMEEYLRYNNVSITEPVVMNVLNRLPKILDKKGQESNKQHEMPNTEAQLFWDHGYLLANGKTLWNRNIPELWELMHACFPMAIDFSSYHRRLRAPLVPGGFVPAVKVRTHNILLEGKLMGADGAGIYDPSHPDMVPLVERYGAVAFQFTAVCKTDTVGKLWKGMLVPRQGINDGLDPELQVAIHFDHLQVKGAAKSEHKAYHKLEGEQSVIDENVYIGFMKAKTKIGRVSSCFETLENIGPDPLQYPDGKNSPQYLADLADTGATIKELTKEACAKIGEDGPEGLLGRATRDDQHLRRLAEFITMANKEGAGINPLDIPILASKVQASLSRTLWPATNGAGFSGAYPISIIDDTLAPGEVVISGYKVGEELACWRFPAILAQSLRVLKVVPGKAHHKVDGILTPNVIWMNSFDITVCQQGDDDGDEVGVSNDPRIVKLFKRRKDNRIFLIEPEGEKFDHATDSPEGRDYIMSVPMGDVGTVTIWKSQLAVAGREEYEIAFAILIQEAIDMQKNSVRFTDVHRAADLNNWWQDPATGWYHIHKEGKTNNFMSSAAGEFPIKYVREAYQEQMVAGGVSKTIKTNSGSTKTVAGHALGWRTQCRIQEKETGGTVEVRIRKSVALDNWRPFREKQDTGKSNWVHLAHDHARECWTEWHKSFTSDQTIPTKEVLFTVLNNLGVALKPLSISWDEYLNSSNAATQGLRVKSGLVKYGETMQKLMAAQTQGSNSTGPLDEQARLARIDSARQELDGQLSKLNAQELLTIWCMELTPCFKYIDRGPVYVANQDQVPDGARSWQVNRPNHAFAAVTNQHSAIMHLLGFSSTEACTWLKDDTRVLKFVNWTRKQDDSFLALTQIIRGNKLHANQCHDDTGAPVQLGDCKECSERLKTALVRSIRSDRTAGEAQACKTLVTSMNKQKHEPIQGLELPTVEAEPAFEEMYEDYLDEEYQYEATF